MSPSAGDPLEHRQLELAAEHRRGGEDVVARPVQPVDAREDEPFDGVGHLHLDLAVQPPVPVLADERAGVQQGAHDLLQVEGIALRAVEDPPLEVDGQRRRPDQRVEQRPVLALVQQIEGELPGAVRQLAQGALAQHPRRVLALRPRDEDDEQSGVLGEIEQGLHELERGGIGPVHVVQRHHERPAFRQRAQKQGHRFERALLDALRCEIDRRPASRLLEQSHEERLQALGLVAEVLRAGRPQASDRSVLGRRRVAQPVEQQAAQGQVRVRLTVRHAAPVQPEASGIPRGGLEVRVELAHEPALPHARLARHEQHTAGSPGHGVEHFAAGRQLALAPDERGLHPLGRPGARRFPARAPDRKRADVLRLALQSEVDGIAPLERALHRPVRALADEHASRRGGSLQPCGRVQGIAHRRVFDLATRALTPEHRQAGLDPHPDGEVLDPVFAGDLDRVDGHLVDDPQPGANGSFGVVLMRRRGAEQSEQPVSRQFDHRSAELLDDGGHPPHRLADDRREVLRVETLAERRRPDDVGEEGADHLARLPFGGRGDGRSAGGTEAMLFRQRAPAGRARAHGTSLIGPIGRITWNDRATSR